MYYYCRNIKLESDTNKFELNLTRVVLTEFRRFLAPRLNSEESSSNQSKIGTEPIHLKILKRKNY